MRFAGCRLFLLVLLLLSIGCESPEQKLAEHRRRAEEALANQDYRGALLELRNALQLEPQSSETNLRIGEVLDGLGNTADAAFFLEEAVRLDPESDEAALALASYLTFSDRERAESLVEDVIARSPGNPLAHVRRSDLALVREDLDVGLASALTAVELDPDNPRTQFQVGLAYQVRVRKSLRDGGPANDQDFESALAALDRSIELQEAGEGEGEGSFVDDQVATRAWLTRMQLLASHEGHEDALLEAYDEAFTRMREHDLKVAKVLQHAQAMGRRLDDRELIVWSLSRTVEVDPGNYGAWQRLAMNQDPRDAADSPTLEKLLEARPEDARAHVTYAEVLARRGARPRAIRHLLSVVDEVDQPEAVLDTLIRMHLQEGQSEEAQALLARLQQEHPDSIQALLAAARAARGEGRLEEARELASQAVERRDNAVTQRLLAEVLTAQGEHSSALAAIEQALTGTTPGDPMRADLLRLKARAHLRLGDPPSAVRAMQQLRGARGKRFDLADRMLLANTLYAAERDTAARKALEPVLALEPPPVRAIALFVSNEMNRDPTRAQALLVAGLEREPANATLLRQAIRLEVAKGNREAALALTQRGVELRPDDGAMLVLHARMLAGTGNADAALEHAEDAVDRFPERDGAIQLYEALLRDRGELDTARTRLEALVAEGQASVGARRVLARLYAESGEYAKELELLESMHAERPELPGVNNDLAYRLAASGGDLKRAAELAREARAALPNAPAVADTLGFVYLKQSLATPALSQFEAAVELSQPQSTVWSTAYYHRGLALLDLERRAEAAESIELALASGNEFPEAEEAREQLRALTQQAQDG